MSALSFGELWRVQSMKDRDVDGVDEQAIETREWLDSMDEVLNRAGPQRVQEILGELSLHAHHKGLRLPFTASTPYVNTIMPQEQPAYPGNRKLEERIESFTRSEALGHDEVWD